MNRCVPLLFLLVTPFSLAEEDSDGAAFLGAWAFELPDGNPAWLQVSNTDSELKARLLWSVGSANPTQNVKVMDGELFFERTVKWKPFGEATVKTVTGPFRCVAKQGKLHLHFSQRTAGDNAPLEKLELIGKPIPPLPPKPDLSTIQFGEPIELFNGKDLTGWKLSNPQKKNGWRAEDGVLVNSTPKTDFNAYGEYGNLITTRQFTDFELSLEYNVPRGGNSGVYLRGLYEAQVVDRDSRMQGIQGPGAIFGRIAPRKNAANPGGEWNRYVLTLVDRHITVVLNGEKVIDNQPLEGCTGGGIQANDTLPGPIFFQGDHTSVKYRNIRLRPVKRRLWIIDPHTHFKGPEQVALESKSRDYHPKNTLGHVVKPEDYRELADRLGIQSTLIVEAVDQNQPQFNDWVLQQAKSNLVCGYIARGDLTSDQFLQNYQRYKSTGYLKGYRFRFEELHNSLKSDTARKHLRLLERDGMVVDLLIEPPHAPDVIQLAKACPQLKIVINHCFRVRMKNGTLSDEWKQAITDCAKHPNVFCKMSSIVNFAEVEAFGNPAPTDLKTYLPILEHTFAAFGEDRILFATNWGVCNHFGTVDDVVRIVTEFLTSKGETALRKGMRDNSIRIYDISAEHLRRSAPQ